MPDGRPAIVVLATDVAGKASLVATVSSDLLNCGVQARHVLQAAGKAIEGGAGSQGALANTGGRQVHDLGQTLHLAIWDRREQFIDQLPCLGTA